MTPTKTKIINNHKVEEYYWAGVHVVYVDNNKVKTDFETTCANLELSTDLVQQALKN